MKQLAFLALLSGALVAPSASSSAEQFHRPPSELRYLFYLHGAIVEEQGPHGVSKKFGRYNYPEIIEAFKKAGFAVRSEVRPRQTDAAAYAEKIAAEVRGLIAVGVDPSRITIVGASKGAVIGAIASDRLRNKRVRYVLLANCNDWLIRTHDPHLTGEVLSIYEASDDIGQSCVPIVKRSPKIARFQEIRVATGLGHGLIYQARDEWIQPAIRWARR